MENAGLLPRSSTSDHGGIVTKSTESVSAFFSKGIAAAANAGFARRSTGATLNDVYYLPNTASTYEILHEALHTFFGARDKELDARHADTTSLAKAGRNGFGRAY